MENRRCFISAYKERQTEFNDGACIVEALQEMGYKVNVHEEAENLEGYHGDKRTQKANIIVPRKSLGSASNDLGFKKQEDGSYKLIVSDFDSGANFNDLKQKKLKQLYAEKKAMKEAKSRGLKFVKKETVQKNNKPATRLVFTKA